MAFVLKNGASIIAFKEILGNYANLMSNKRSQCAYFTILVLNSAN